MAKPKLILKPSLEKDLRKLPSSVVDRVLDKIENLPEDPLPPGTEKLSGSERQYRIRVGDYRIIYEFNSKTETITIHYVRHRRDVYKKR